MKCWNLARINKHVTWHSGRHAFAMWALEHNVDLYTVKDILGHSDIRATQIYAKIRDKRRDRAIDKLPIL